jgi:hypothetical protein
MKMVDGGAPTISLAQAEFERQATHWQEQARQSADTARYYTMLASELRQIYRHTLAESSKTL